MNTYWTRPELRDEWETIEQAQKWLEEDFIQSHADSGADYGDRYEDDIEIILYDFDLDKELDRKTITVFAEFDCSDREEHGTYWGRP